MTSGTKRQEELKQASAVRQDLAPRTAENCSSTDIHVMGASHQMPEKVNKGSPTASLQSPAENKAKKDDTDNLGQR